MTCARRRRAEVQFCLPSADEHLLSNTTRLEAGRKTRTLSVTVNQKLCYFMRLAHRLWAEIKDFGLVWV